MKLPHVKYCDQYGKNESLLNLSKEQVQFFIGMAEEMVNNPLVVGEKHIKWRLLGKKNGISVHRAYGYHFATKCTTVLSVDFEEIMNTMVMDTTHTFCHRMKQMDPYFVDGKVLDTFIPTHSSMPHRYMGIKWASYCIPGCTKLRDFLYLEYIDRGTDVTGRHVGFRVVQSIELPIVLVGGSKDMIRGNIKCGGIVFRTTHNTRLTEVRNIMDMDFGTKALQESTLAKIATMYGKMLTKIGDYSERKQLTEHYLSHNHRHVPQELRRNCQVCIKEFKGFRLKHHCRICGEIICGNCSNLKKIDLSIIQRDHIRVCIKCIIDAKKDSPAIVSPGWSMSIHGTKTWKKYNTYMEPEGDSVVEFDGPFEVLVQSYSLEYNDDYDPTSNYDSTSHGELEEEPDEDSTSMTEEWDGTRFDLEYHKKCSQSCKYLLQVNQVVGKDILDQIQQSKQIAENLRLAYD